MPYRVIHVIAGWRGKPRETLIRTEQGREIDTVLQHGFTLVTVASVFGYSDRSLNFPCEAKCSHAIQCGAARPTRPKLGPFLLGRS